MAQNHAPQISSSLFSPILQYSNYNLCMPQNLVYFLANLQRCLRCCFSLNQCRLWKSCPETVLHSHFLRNLEIQLFLSLIAIKIVRLEEMKQLYIQF